MKDGSSVAAGSDVAADRRRWVICALLFAATAINYIDRQMIGVLKPTLQDEFGWSERDYANIIFAFQAAYALGYAFLGRFVDRVGARVGLAVVFGVWTLAHLAHGFARGLTDLVISRFVLGLGESGAFPAGLKATSEWFAPKERALAVGLFNAGANIGAIATPLIVPALTLAFGWRAAFFVTAIGSTIWLVLWLALYRTRRPVPSFGADPALVEGETQVVRWSDVVRTRALWAYALGKFLTDPIWWMFLFWLPDFLGRRHGLDLKSFGPPLVVIYLISDAGSVLGGWFSSSLMRRGRLPNVARKLALLVCALAAVPIFFAQQVESLWVAVLLIGLATAGHQGFSANLLTLPSDLFPRSAVGTVVGIGGTAGAVGGMVMAQYAGAVLEAVGSYQPIFAVAAFAYLLALACIHLLCPRLDPASLPVSPQHGKA